MNKIISRLCVAVVLSIMPMIVLAESVGIAVDKTAIVMDTGIGEEYEFVVKLKSVVDIAQQVEVLIYDYKVQEDNNIKLSEGYEVAGLKDWVNLSNNTFIIKPGQTILAKATLKIPLNASIGSHRGIVVFRASPLKTQEKVKIQGQIGVHILANVNGDTYAHGKINSFEIPLFVTGEVVYETVFENTGNVHYVPKGEISIQNVVTNKEFNYPYEKHFVFPGNKFYFTRIENIPSLMGLYRVQSVFIDGEGVKLVHSKYMVGYLFPAVFIVISVGMIILFWRVVKIVKRRKISGR